jgi:hypothetical protein
VRLADVVDWVLVSGRRVKDEEEGVQVYIGLSVLSWTSNSKLTIPVPAVALIPPILDIRHAYARLLYQPRELGRVDVRHAQRGDGPGVDEGFEGAVGLQCGLLSVSVWR